MTISKPKPDFFYIGLISMVSKNFSTLLYSAGRSPFHHYQQQHQQDRYQKLHTKLQHIFYQTGTVFSFHTFLSFFIANS